MKAFNSEIFLTLPAEALKVSDLYYTYEHKISKVKNMMNQQSRILIIAALVAGLFSSCEKKNADGAQTPAEVADTVQTAPAENIPAEDEVTGVVYDATMNTVVLITTQGDTLSFGGMEDAEKVTSDQGLLIGDTVVVTYEGDLKQANSFPMATASKVVVKPARRSK